MLLRRRAGRRELLGQALHLHVVGFGRRLMRFPRLARLGLEAQLQLPQRCLQALALPNLEG